jgi:hypothetical protein
MYCCQYSQETGAIVDHSCSTLSKARPEIFNPGSDENSPLQSMGSSHDDSSDEMQGRCSSNSR